MRARLLRPSIAVLASLLAIVAAPDARAEEPDDEPEISSGVGLPRVSRVARESVAWRPLWVRAEQGGWQLEARMPSCGVTHEPARPAGTGAVPPVLPGVAGSARCDGSDGAPLAPRPASSLRAQYESEPWWDDGPGLSIAWQARGHDGRGTAAGDGGAGLRGQSLETELWQSFGPVDLAVGHALPVGPVPYGERWQAVYASADWTPTRGQWMQFAVDLGRELDRGGRDRRITLAWGGRAGRSSEGVARWSLQLARAFDMPGERWTVGLGLDWRY